MFFPECVAVGSHFTLGVWGWTCVFSTLLLCPQPFAARPQRGPYGRAYGELQKRCATSFRVAGMALRDIPTCFITCQKSFFVTGTKLLHGFQTMICIFCGRHSALETSMFILRGRRSFGEDPSCVGCHAFFAAGAVFWTLSCLQLWRVECGVKSPQCRAWSVIVECTV